MKHIVTFIVLVNIYIVNLCSIANGKSTTTLLVKDNKLKVELKDLRSRHIDMRTTLMTLSKTTNVAEEVKTNGLLYSSDAPYKIKIED